MLAGTALLLYLDDGQPTGCARRRNVPARRLTSGQPTADRATAVAMVEQPNAASLVQHGAVVEVLQRLSVQVVDLKRHRASCALGEARNVAPERPLFSCRGDGCR
jgi:hypothetical protein